ncbi:MAG: carboxypeptidase-like regulatory domain-containing protein [Pirellulales bacterium]
MIPLLRMCPRRVSPQLHFAATLMLLLALGCGSGEPLGQVSGVVTLAGEPVTNGSVVFENRELGISVRANLDDQGRYHVRTYDQDGLPPGDYQVAVTSTRTGSGASPFVGDPADQQPTDTGPAIPEKYFKIATSDLSAHVDAGPNTIDFPLK